MYLQSGLSACRFLICFEEYVLQQVFIQFFVLGKVKGAALSITRHFSCCENDQSVIQVLLFSDASTVIAAIPPSCLLTPVSQKPPYIHQG